MAEISLIPDELLRQQREREAAQFAAPTAVAAPVATRPMAAPTPVGRFASAAAAPAPARIAPPAAPAVAPPSAGPAPELGAPNPLANQTMNPFVQAAEPTPAKPTGKEEYKAGMPSVTAEPFTKEWYAQREAKNAFEQGHPLGSDISAHPGLGGKVLHGLGKLGNVLGNIFVPGAMQEIPGTQMNRELEEKRLGAGYNQGVENELKEAQAKKAGTPPEKFAFHYMQPNGTTIGVRPDGSTEELPAGAQKPSMKVQGFDVMGPDGKPQHTMAIVDESKLQNMKPANGQQFTLPELEAIGAVSPLNMGQPAPKAGGAKYKMIPVDADHEQLQVFNDPNDPTKGTPIGAVKRNGTNQIFINPNDPSAPPKLIDTNTGKVSDIQPEKGKNVNETLGGAMPAMAARAEIMRQGQFQTAYLKPATDIEQNYEKAQAAMKAYNADPQTGAASMVMLAMHLGSTMGSVKGAAIGEEAIKFHKDAVSVSDRVDRWIDSVKSGQELSANQIKEFGELLSETRRISWQIAAHVGQYRKMDLSFLPHDSTLKIKMSDGKGAAKDVTADKVQGLAAKGFRIE